MKCSDGVGYSVENFISVVVFSYSSKILMLVRHKHEDLYLFFFTLIFTNVKSAADPGQKKPHDPFLLLHCRLYFSGFSV